MADAPQTRLWLGRITYLGIVFVLVFAHLVPLETVPQSWAMPDLILAVTMVWVARRPDYVPVLAIASVMLLTDLLFQRPPGLWAALVLIATEMFRSRASVLRNLPFLLEWASVSVAIVAIAVVYRVVLALVDAPQAALFLTITQIALTCAIYPVIVVIAHFVFGVSRPAPGQVDALGHRL